VDLLRPFEQVSQDSLSVGRCGSYVSFKRLPEPSTIGHFVERLAMLSALAEGANLIAELNNAV
jgi:hypothetical protein